ncbi:MAG: colicin E3/pyocin S6 family cytotoxin [Polyangiaceae bacterium]
MSVNTEVALAVNVIFFVEQLRQDLLKMVPPPKTLAGFPGTRPVRPKTGVLGGGALRKRWVDEAEGIRSHYL